MSRFRSQFKRAGARQTVAQHGETVIYYPLDAGYGRPIKAIVTRSVEVVNESGKTAQVIRCSVIDDATDGISASEINDARDAISVALTVGGELVKRQLTYTDDDSNGMVRFRVR